MPDEVQLIRHKPKPVFEKIPHDKRNYKYNKQRTEYLRSRDAKDPWTQEPWVFASIDGPISFPAFNARYAKGFIGPWYAEKFDPADLFCMKYVDQHLLPNMKKKGKFRFEYLGMTLLADMSQFYGYCKDYWVPYHYKIAQVQYQALKGGWNQLYWGDIQNKVSNVWFRKCEDILMKHDLPQDAACILENAALRFFKASYEKYKPIAKKQHGAAKVIQKNWKMQKKRKLFPKKQQDIIDALDQAIAAGDMPHIAEIAQQMDIEMMDAPVGNTVAQQTVSSDEDMQNRKRIKWQPDATAFAAIENMFVSPIPISRSVNPLALDSMRRTLNYFDESQS